MILILTNILKLIIRKKKIKKLSKYKFKKKKYTSN